MGLVFVATVLWAPHGVVGLAGRLRARLAAGARGGGAVTTAAAG
jgi:hypothetical protein